VSRRVLVVLSDGFEDIEAVVPLDIMKRVGFEVTVAGLSSTTVRGAYGATLTVEATLNDVAGDSFDAIVLPGGRANAENLARSPQVAAMVRRMHAERKVVAAICASVGLVLAEAAGILVGKRATGFPAFDEKLSQGGAIITGELVTVDGNIVTGMGAGAAIPFGLAICAGLGAERAAAELARGWWIETLPRPVR